MNQLESEKNLLEQIFNIAADGIRLVDTEFNILRVNETFAKMIGLSPNDIVGKKCFKVFHGPLCNTPKCPLSRVLSGEEFIEIEVYKECVDGTKIPCIIVASPFKDLSGEVIGIIEDFKDITERKKKEQKLIESEEKFRILFENSINGIAYHSIIYDKSGDPIDYIITDVNQQYEKILSLKKEDVINKKATEIYNVESAPYIDIYSRVAATQETTSFETYFPPMDKNFNISIISPKKGEFITVFDDITKRKQAEENLRQFTAIASHELRTPIFVITQALDNLRSYKDRISKEKKAKLKENIDRNARLLSELVENLLITATIDGKRISLTLKEYNPLGLIRDVLKQLEPQRLVKKIFIDVDINGDIMLIGDKQQIGQVFRILIDNAIKYSDTNSKIEIKGIDHYEGKYNTRGVDGTLFRFKDNGFGIREEDIPRLFQRFFRASNVKSISGTGLGLSIAKELITLHGGKIFVESEYAKGSTFFVFLPHEIEGL